MTIYAGVKDFQVFSRNTKERNYEYVVIGKDSKFNDNVPEWKAVSWAGNMELARKKARSEQGNWHNIEILPVFEKSPKELKFIKQVTAVNAGIHAEAAAQKAQAEAEAQARAEEAEAQVRRAALQTAQDEAAREAAGYQAATQAALFSEYEAEAARQAQAREEADAALFVILAEQEEEEEEAQVMSAYYTAKREEEQNRFKGKEEAEEAPQGAQAGPEGYAPSLICKRCGKILTGPESVARGYGDKCWRKVWRVVKGLEEPAPAADYGGTITDPAQALKTRLEIDRRICNSDETCLCGESLRAAELRSYDHEGGYRAPGYLNPQWFYMKCGHCYHENSLRKIPSVDIEDIETEGRREAGVRLAAEEARKGLKPAPVHYLGTGQANPGPAGMGKPGGALEIIRQELQALQDAEQGQARK